VGPVCGVRLHRIGSDRSSFDVVAFIAFEIAKIVALRAWHDSRYVHAVRAFGAAWALDRYERRAGGTGAGFWHVMHP
jgi:hypothetical protein